MDPNSNLKEILELARTIQDDDDNERVTDPTDAPRLALLVLALDAWITNGGFLPARWREGLQFPALYAWVGEDELGSGKIGIKQGLVPAGMIPLVAVDYHLDRLTKLVPAMEAQATFSGKKIRLVKFEATSITATTESGT